MEKITLNMTPSACLTTCHASQYDIGRQVRFNLVNGADNFVLSGGETVTLKIIRADGVFVENQVPNTSSNYVIWTSVAGECDAAGISECELSVTDGGDLLGSANFWMEVEPDAYGEGAVVIRRATGDPAIFETDLPDVAAECVLKLGYNAEGYTRATVINSETAPAQDATPYLFRKSGGDLASIGTQEFDTITGGTVAFNQLVGYFAGNAATISNVSTNEYKATSTALRSYFGFNLKQTNSVNISTVANNIYFMSLDITELNVANITGIEISGGFYKGVGTSTGKRAYILKANSTNTLYINATASVTTTMDDNFTIKNVNVINLTEMFGSTIADYIYSLETGTPGAGVAWFRALFPAEYYAYNAGELLSVKTSAHVTTGKNIFNLDLSDAGASVKYVPLFVGNGVCTMSSTAPLVEGVAILFLLAGNVSSGASTATNGVSSGIPRTVTTTDGYITIGYRYHGSPTVYPAAFDTQLEFGDTATTFEEYHADTYALDPDLELRGILKLDSNNKIYYDGDTYESDGHVGRRFGIADLGSLTWNISPQGFFNANLSGVKYVTSANQKPNLVCPLYVLSTPSRIYGQQDDMAISTANGASAIWINNSNYNDKDVFKTAMEGVYLVYELATPSEETADAFTNPQDVNAYGTEAYTDSRTVPMPVGHSTIYGDDLKAYIIDFGHTVYGGTLNLTTGELTGDKNADGSDKTPPDVYQITPRAVDIREGDNQIFGNTDGDITVDYYAKA